jgi:hypothetical protein
MSSKINNDCLNSLSNEKMFTFYTKWLRKSHYHIIEYELVNIPPERLEAFFKEYAMKMFDAAIRTSKYYTFHIMYSHISLDLFKEKLFRWLILISKNLWTSKIII